MGYIETNIYLELFFTIWVLLDTQSDKPVPSQQQFIIKMKWYIWNQRTGSEGTSKMYVQMAQRPYHLSCIYPQLMLMYTGQDGSISNDRIIEEKKRLILFTKQSPKCGRSIPFLQHYTATSEKKQWGKTFPNARALGGIPGYPLCEST